ncbi:MAG: phage/plasmid primase, P4 family [Candidatus Nanopusillus acidilobi]
MEIEEKQEDIEIENWYKNKEIEEWLKSKIIRQDKVFEGDKNKPAKFLPFNCAVELENLFEFYTDQNTDELYIYHEDKGIWKPDGEAIINKIVETQLGYKISTRAISEVIDHIKRHNNIDPDKLNVNTSLINLKNGVLDLENNQLLPHNPIFYFKNYVNVKYNPEPKIPQKIIDFLLDRAGNDEKFIDLLESLAFPLLPDYRIHSAVMLVGETHTGKTTYLELLQRIYGKENASHLTIQQLAKASQEHPFILTSLIDKTINIADDLPERPITDVGLFKQLTGESYIIAEKKFGGIISFVNRAKMYFSANKIPEVYENTNAFYSRWLIIEFNKPIVNEIPNFVNELTSEDELSNILPLLVWIARNKLMKNTRFTFSKTAEQNMNIYAKHSNTAKLYCETRLKVNPEGKILKEVIFDDYKKWCEKHNYLEETEKSFWHTLKSYFADQENVAEKRITTEGITKRFMVGLEFKEEEIEEEEETETNQNKDLLREYFEIDKIEKNDKPDTIQIYIKEIYDYIMTIKNLIK